MTPTSMQSDKKTCSKFAKGFSMRKKDLLGPLLADNKLIEPTANFFRRGEPSAEIRATPPAGFPAPVLPIKPFPAGARDPNHIDPPHGGARGCAVAGGIPRLAPDLRRLPAIRAAGPAAGDGVQGGGCSAGETALLLLLLAPEEGPRASEVAGAAAALLPLLRGAPRVDAARGGERGRRGAGGAYGGRHGVRGAGWWGFRAGESRREEWNGIE